MRSVLALAVLSVSLAACGSSASSPSPTPKRTKTPAARLETIPATSPAPTPKGGFPTANPHATPARLATLPPILAATPTPFPASAYTAVIYGTITDAKTHAPLAGVIVTVGNNHRAVTGPFGRYRLTFPAGPPVAVTVQEKGYASAPAMGQLTVHQKWKLDWALQPIIPGQRPAPPAPTIFGHIGKP